VRANDASTALGVAALRLAVPARTRLGAMLSAKHADGLNTKFFWHNSPAFVS